MKKEELSDALDFLQDDLLERTDDVRRRSQKPRIHWQTWAGLAACLALLAIYAGTRLLPPKVPDDPAQLPALTTESETPEHMLQVPTETPTPPTSSSREVPKPPETQEPTQPPAPPLTDPSQLPKLAVQEFRTDGMGFEDYMAHDISELVNANPWKEDTHLFTLPVYQNPLTYDRHWIASGTDWDRAREFLLEIAGRLGLDPDALTITDDVPDEETRKWLNEKESRPDGYLTPTELIAKADGIQIEINQEMTATIHFDPALSLPAGYNFAYDSSYEDTLAAAEYIKTEYADLIGFDNPQLNLNGGDYNISLQQHYETAFFDADGSLTEQIVNYNFNQVIFYGEVGAFDLARIFQPDLSKKVGDYPLITVDEARERLANGNYVTTIPCEMPGMESVKKVELIYRTGKYDDYFMPYYRFYVELRLPENEQRELPTFGAYYVPAIQEAYLTDLPVWGGHFN